MKAKRLKKFNKETQCHYCHREFGEGLSQLTVDHKIPISKGGIDDIENAVLCCKRCNMWKGSKSYRDFIDIYLPKYLEAVKNNPNVKTRKNRPVLSLNDFNDLFKK